MQMVALPEIPKWTDIWQAQAAAGTAIFTALSVFLVCVYTIITRHALKIAQRTHEESLRPVLILLKVELLDGRRVATFKNAGGGLAVSIRLSSAAQTVMADNNVLASGEILPYALSLEPSQGILDIRCISLTGKEVRTISYFLADGTAFNDYVIDAKKLKADKVKGMYSAITKYALKEQAYRLEAKKS